MNVSAGWQVLLLASLADNTVGLTSFPRRSLSAAANLLPWFAAAFCFCPWSVVRRPLSVALCGAARWLSPAT